MSPRRAKAVKGRVGDDPATALRNHLIDVAERLLAERPVAAITTRDIARAAEVSDGVLYNYFAGKDDLLVTALVRRFGSIVAQHDADLPAPGTASVEENLTTYAHASLGVIAEALPLVAALLTEPLLLHRFFEEIHGESLGPQLTFMRLADYLRGECELGRLSAVDVDAATALLIGATGLVALHRALGAPNVENVSVEARLPAMVGLLTRGLEAAHQPQPPGVAEGDGADAG
jgi:AcrR family transcriptional regulator